MSLSRNAPFPNSHLAMAVIFLALVVVCGFMFVRTKWLMVSAINRAVDPQQQISHLWNYTGKFLRVQAEYRALYPAGKLALHAWTWLVLAGLSALGQMYAWGII